MKKPTTFKPAELVVAMITNFVLLAKNLFIDLSILFFYKEEVKYLKAIKIKSTAILVFFLFFAFNIVQAQDPVGTKFSARLDDGKGNKYFKVQGDVKLIGNSILRPDGERLPYNGTKNNNDLNAVYIDIDGDGNTTSSSSANLLINNGCKRIVFAGLYWSAMYPNEVANGDSNCFNCGTAPRDDWNEVLFKMPNRAYERIVADKANPREVIFKGSNANDFNNGVYVCFKDVTAKLQGLTEADGEYTVANLRATRGIRRGGAAGGWTLVVIYESPTVTSKYISVFDGAQMTNVDPGTNQLLKVDIPISGFQTVRDTNIPVIAKVGVAALDGDLDRKGDGLLFRNGLVPTSALNSSFTPITNSLNLTTLSPESNSNFFNASITVDNAHVTNRNPASQNNLGFDIDYLEIPNPNNTVIPNGATEGTYRMFTNTSGADGYAAFVTTFAVEIIEPKITLTKEVFDYSTTPPTNMGNKDVTLGKELNYVIGFQNQGNDNAINFTITDKLPINTKFNYPADIIDLPPPIVIGRTTYRVTHTYDAATRTITFTIPKEYVEVKDPRYTIRFKVKVVESCSEISDVCSNVVRNEALSKYNGFFNSNIDYGDYSLDSYTNCNIGIPQSTNFLVDVDDCKFERNEVLCGTSIQIKAANGYSSYSWSTSPTGTPVIGTDQTLTVVKEGVYYVKNTAPAPCLSIAEKFTVTLPNGLLENPVLPYAREPYAGNITVCPDNGKLLPNLFLCGAADFRDIRTGISATGTTMVWEKLNEGSCTAVANDKCANENASCTWTEVGTGPNYRADTKGQYRLTIKYQNNCVNQFYFNVFKNEVNPTVTYNDIYCNTKGKITVNGLPTGYVYSLTKNGTYTSTNTFTINTAGNYTVYIKQTGVVTNPCIFEVSVNIVDRKLEVETIVTHPVCFGDKGSIKVNTSGVRGQYYYELFRNGNSVQKVGPVASGDYTFNNLDQGGYSYTVRTDDGCSYTNYYVAINQSAGEIIASAAITRPLTDCTTGIIKITASQDRNWSNSFYYFVNGSSTFQTSNEIEVTTAGLYTIRVVGNNNCEKIVTIDVPKTPKPTYDIVAPTNINCYGEPAEIRINLTSSTAGYTMGYSINDGATYQTSPVFTNLTPGTYKVKVRYSVTYPVSYPPYTETQHCSDPSQTVTITGPTSSVTASAGVAELAGCGPLENGLPTGLIRFTNVEGGTAPYEYSFNGGGSWQASPEKFVVSSTVPYDLRVRDKFGCFYKIPYNVILDPKPQDPSIDNNITPIYNCDGSATATVVVNTPTSSGSTYTYEYYLKKDGSATAVPNNPITSNVFNNVPAGNHKVIVKYNIQTVSTYSNLLQEDFGNGGDTQSPGINSLYCWEKQDGNTDAFASCPAIDGWHSWLLNDGDYVVTNALLPDHDPDFRWILPKDHTAVLNNTTGITNGRFLAVNIGELQKGAVLYSKTINDILPYQDMSVSLYMINLLKESNALASPQLTVRLVKNGVVVGTPIDFPLIPRDEKWHSTTDLAGGQIFKLNPGNNTSLEFQILSNLAEIQGNDLAIDDILVYQVPKACGNEIEIPVVVNTNGAFTVPTPGVKDTTCSNTNDGTITISASNFGTGFFYSTDNGASWDNSTTSPVTVTKGAGTYKVIVKNDVAGTCQFSFEAVIKSPQAILIVKVDKTAVTCAPSPDGSITVTTVTGGTGSYQYQLSDASGIVRVFQSGKTFAGLGEGTYKVMVKDANGCLSPASEDIVITRTTGPTATLAASSDLCYTPSNPASLVVTVTGGLSPYTYKLDNNTPITTNTFNNVGVGTHTIVVTDSNNCTATISNIIIQPELKLTASLAQDLTCLVNASITSVVTGGHTGAYTYTVSRNGATATAASFPYTATQPGNYVFTVTDSKGCTATSNTVVVSPKTTPGLTFGKTDITCNNANDGTITVTGTNGFTSVYTYAIKLSSASTYTTQTTNQFAGLAAGTYNIKVIDSKGCESAVSNVTILNPTAVGGTISATELGCSSTGTVPAVVTVVGSGGSGSYQYSFNGTTNFTSSNTYSTSSAGTVTAYIKDSKGCLLNPPLEIVINPRSSITGINVLFDTGLECPAYEAHVKFQAIGGLSPIRYQIIAGPAGYSSAIVSDGEFKNLKPGDYIFRATDKNGCSFDLNYKIKSTPDVVAGGSVLTPIKCFNGTGTLQFTVNGVKDRGYDYVIRNAGGTVIQSANNVSETVTTINVTAAQPAGVYTITVTDRKTSCPATYSLTLTQPSAALSATVAQVNANCNVATSKVTVTAAGGTPGYTYAYKQNNVAPVAADYVASNSADLNPATNTQWDVWVKDLNGCTVK
ncbi:hypothetical protein AAEO57_08375, partial [Flavobacterium sp. DGU38]